MRNRSRFRGLALARGGPEWGWWNFFARWNFFSDSCFFSWCFFVFSVFSFARMFCKICQRIKLCSTSSTFSALLLVTFKMMHLLEVFLTFHTCKVFFLLMYCFHASVQIGLLHKLFAADITNYFSIHDVSEPI